MTKAKPSGGSRAGANKRPAQSARTGNRGSKRTYTRVIQSAPVRGKLSKIQIRRILDKAMTDAA